MSDLAAREVRAILYARVSEMGSQKAVAQAFGVSQAFLSDVLRGKRELSDGILKGLGLVRVVTYRKSGVPR